MRLPKIYGTPATDQLQTWTHTDQRLREATHYWISTVDSQGRPHATQVDGIWMDGLLYFGGDPGTKRQRNLRSNAAVCIHLESADDVVIVHGIATTLTEVGIALAKRLSAASKKKYGYGPTPEMYQASAISFVRPEVAMAWTDLTKDPTRFTFEATGLSCSEPEYARLSARTRSGGNGTRRLKFLRAARRQAAYRYVA